MENTIVKSSFLTSEEISLINKPLPLETNSYKPLPNRAIIETINEILDKNGMYVSDKYYMTDNNKNKVAARYKLGGFGLETADIGMQLAWINSYDKSMSAKFSIGGNVFVCTNGVIRGDRDLKRKHTGSIFQELTQAITEEIEKISEEHEKVQEDAFYMKQIQVSKKAASELLGRMFIEHEILTSTQLNIIKRELDDSKNFAFVNNFGSVWDLYNNCTEALKESHPTNFLQSHIDLHSFVKEEFMF